MLKYFGHSLCFLLAVFEGAAAETSLLARMNAMESKASAMESKASAMESKVISLQAQIQKHAAFSARFDGTQKDLNIGDSATIRFPTVITNIGNGYNPLTGYFTAPYFGDYVFYFHMRSTNNYGFLAVSIYKDNQELMVATADGSSNHWNRGNVLVTTHLNAGDKVYCRHTGGSTWLEEGSLTNFSGFLVHAD